MIHIDYEQLYAQVMDEVTCRDLRYWFTNEETRQIQQANQQFQQEQDLCTMLEYCFRHAEKGESVQMVPVKHIIEILESQYPMIKKSHSFSIQLGTKLKALGYKQNYIHGISHYDVVPRLSA